jgi:hypothetical protein
MKLKLLFYILLSVGIYSATAAELPPAQVENTRPAGPVVLGQNYPNPAKSKTEIVVEFKTSEAVLRIYDVLGKKVEEIIVSSDKKTITIDVSDYKEGIYLYSIEADGQKVTKRMTVRK